MMRNVLLRNFVSVLVLLPSVCMALNIEQDWSAQTAHDLAQAKQLLIKNSPEYVDQQPPFAHWLEEGYQQSMRLAKQTTSEAGYFYVLDYYARGFGDSQITADLPLENNYSVLDMQFSGVLLTLSNTSYKVTYRDASFSDLPPMGAELVSCDQKPVNVILNQELLPFYGVLGNDASYYTAAKHFFLDANPFRELPRLCTFKVKDSTFTFYPKWRSVTKDKYQSLLGHYDSNQEQSVTAFGDNGLWVRMPRFDFVTAAEERFYNMLISSAVMFREYDPVVIDLRGNVGGAMDWPKAFIQKFFGRGYYEQQLASKDGWLQFRVSERNVSIANQSKTLTPKTKKALHQALSQGETWYPKQKPEAEPFDKDEVAINAFKGRLYVLTDNQCVASCLLIAADLSRYPNTTFIGLPTQAHSPYMGRNLMTLDGGAVLAMPVQAYRDYSANFGEAIQPKYVFTGDITSQRALQEWVGTISR